MLRSTTKLVVFILLVCMMFSLSQADGQDARRARRKFYRGTLTKEKATLSDATQIASMLKFGEFDNTSDEARLATLIEKGIAPKAWADRKQDDEINRGELAYMFVRALRIKGGLKMRLGIKNQRYCYREMVGMGLIARGNQRRKVSGAELIGILDKCTTYKIVKNKSK